MNPLLIAELELHRKGWNDGRGSLRQPILDFCTEMERVCSRLRGENRFEANRIIHALRELVKEEK